MKPHCTTCTCSTFDVSECDGAIVIGHETITCYATGSHPGRHFAIVCTPCSACGGYDECHRSCAIYDAEPIRWPVEHWYSWADGDLALRRESPDAGRAWRSEFQLRAAA